MEIKMTTILALKVLKSLTDRTEAEVEANIH